MKSEWSNVCKPAGPTVCHEGQAELTAVGTQHALSQSVLWQFSEEVLRYHPILQGMKQRNREAQDLPKSAQPLRRNAITKLHPASLPGVHRFSFDQVLSAVLVEHKLFVKCTVWGKYKE